MFHITNNAPFCAMPLNCHAAQFCSFFGEDARQTEADLLQEGRVGCSPQYGSGDSNHRR